MSSKKTTVTAVRSVHTYPPAYAVKPIDEQVILLAKKLSLSPDGAMGYIEKTLPRLQLPRGAEGFFAFARWKKVGKTYGQALTHVIGAIQKERPFYNWLQGQLGKRHLRQMARTVEMLDRLGASQKGDILIAPGQFGLRYRGYSIHDSRETFTATEFGHGAFAVACMLLTHPLRLTSYNDLWIDCAGDECDPQAIDDFVAAPYFRFGGAKLRFVTRWIGSALPRYGSVSGFLLS